jgi:hypothetical protein
LTADELNEIANIVCSTTARSKVREAARTAFQFHVRNAVHLGASPCDKDLVRKFFDLAARPTDNPLVIGSAAGFCAAYATRFPDDPLTATEIERVWMIATTGSRDVRQAFASAVVFAKWDVKDSGFYKRLCSLYEASLDDEETRQAVLRIPLAAMVWQLADFASVIRAYEAFKLSEHFVSDDNDTMIYAIFEARDYIEALEAKAAGPAQSK